MWLPWVMVRFVLETWKETVSMCHLNMIKTTVQTALWYMWSSVSTVIKKAHRIDRKRLEQWAVPSYQAPVRSIYLKHLATEPGAHVQVVYVSLSESSGYLGIKHTEQRQLHRVWCIPRVESSPMASMATPHRVPKRGEWALKRVGEGVKRLT